MEQTNATVDCDVSRLDMPLRPFKARQGHNFVATLRRVPADVTKVYARIFRAKGAYYDLTAHEHRGGEWSVRIPAACFPEQGEFRYEVHGTAMDDQPCALGEGRLVVDAFSATTAPIQPGTVQEVAQLPCEGGGFVQVVMKWDGFAWVQEAVYNASASDSEVG